MNDLIHKSNTKNISNKEDLKDLQINNINIGNLKYDFKSW